MTWGSFALVMLLTGAAAPNARVRFTDTWPKMADGRWQCIASHDSPIK